MISIMPVKRKVNILYIVHDGRTRYDTDSATVLETCKTRKTRRQYLAACKVHSHGSFDWDPVVFQYHVRDKMLVDEKLAYDPKAIAVTGQL